MSLLRAIALLLLVGCIVCVLVSFYRTSHLPSAQLQPSFRKNPDLHKDLHKLVSVPPSHTIVVIIPFRDREGHLVKFKRYWRWFVSNQSLAGAARLRWEIFVIEQFDAEAFNRGWNFNVGLAIASAQRTASPEITSAMEIKFKCAVIQDIDYLPETGVDYADCDSPVQLSSEIDRYNWKTPYLKSAGGIVGMSLAHWRQINGFGNDYFGWGGEDDELHHRLRINNLLFGDCHPFCADGDKRIGRTGISIRRPKKGHGRFSGKFMHSANHTKRVTDAKLYKANVAMVADIEHNGSRWRNDGLSNLAFRILSNEVDSTDSETYGIAYHHVRVRRTKNAYDIPNISLAIPLSVCLGQNHNSEWSLETLGHNVPWDLSSLRSRALQSGKLQCIDQTQGLARRGNFILIDRKRCLAKILDDDDPRLLISFYRSLQSAGTDGLIVFQLRPRQALQQAFAAKNAFDVPASQFTVCKSDWYDTVKYSVHEGSVCSSNGWNKVRGGTFTAFAKNRSGLQPVSFCDNEEHWTQRFVLASQCNKKWAGLHWTHGGSFWVLKGEGFCVGSRETEKRETMRFSRLLAQNDCSGDGFVHEFSFRGMISAEKAVFDTPDDGHYYAPPAKSNIMRKGTVKYVFFRVKAKSDAHIGLFPKTLPDEGAANTAGALYEVAIGAWSNTKSVIRKAAGGTPMAESSGQRLSATAFRDFWVSVDTAAGRVAVGEGHDLAMKGFMEFVDTSPIDPVNFAVMTGFGASGDWSFPRSAAVDPVSEDPSMQTSNKLREQCSSHGPLELARSTPDVDMVTPLYHLVEEEVPCFSFLCPQVPAAAT